MQENTLWGKYVLLFVLTSFLKKKGLKRWIFCKSSGCPSRSSVIQNLNLHEMKVTGDKSKDALESEFDKGIVEELILIQTLEISFVDMNTASAGRGVH